MSLFSLDTKAQAAASSESKSLPSNVNIKLLGFQ